MALTLQAIYSRCDEVGDCLLWNGPMRNGSPQVFTGKPLRKYIQARRFVYEQKRGPIPHGRFPVMSCREPRCLAHAHMKLLTSKQIGALAAKEGKFSSPQRRMAIALGKRRSKSAKLTPELAASIRSSDVPSPAMAAQLDVHRSLVSRVRRGEAWAELVPNASVFNLARSA